MHRILGTITVLGHGYEVSSYRAAFVIAAIVTLALAGALARARGVSTRDTLAVLGSAALALPVGARAWHVVTNPGIYAETPAAAWSLDPTGFAMFGGIAAAALAGLLVARSRGVDVWRLADAAAPALGVGIAIMRLGCFANGCCFGLPTNGPFGVTFPAGSYAHLWEMAHGYVGLFGVPIPVHPAELYEAAGALACAALALAVRRRAPDGVGFLTFVGAFAIVRGLNWIVRVHPDTLTHPGIYWLIYPAVAVGCALAIRVRCVRFARQTGRT